MLTSPVEISGLQHAQQIEFRRDLWRSSSPAPGSSRVSYSTAHIHLQCNNSAAQDQDYNWLQVKDMQRIEFAALCSEHCKQLAVFSLTRDLIILEESVCQNHMVNCQIMPSLSHAKGLCQQHLPFMVFKHHFGSEVKSTERRRMLNSKSSLSEQAQREKQQIPLKSLKARLRFTHIHTARVVKQASQLNYRS